MNAKLRTLDASAGVRTLDPTRDVALAARRLSALAIDARVADVCPCCGGHAEPDLVLRLALLERGGEALCARCGITKEVGAVALLPDPGIGSLAKSKAYGGGAWEEPKLGRFRVLKRTDGKFVVYDEDVVGGRSPVFDDVNLAKWRVWWRALGEKKTGLRLGQACFVGLYQEPCVLIDFVDERRAGVRFVRSGVVDYVPIGGLSS